MEKVRQASWIGLFVVIALLAGCGGCGGEKTAKGDKKDSSTKTETDFTSASAAAETYYVPPPVQPTPQPVPMFKANVPQVLVLGPQTAGDASAGILESALLGAVGVMSAGQPGDYILANSKCKLIFKAITPRKPEELLTAPLNFTNRRHEGALVDVITTQSPVDFLDEYTQALGTDSGGPVVEYDSAEFVRRDAVPGAEPEAVGLKLTGSLAKSETDALRIETTYWLASGASRIDVRTQVLSGDQLALITDFANFGPANVLADVHGPPPRSGIVVDTGWCAAQLGKIALGLGVTAGRLEGHFLHGALARFLPYQQIGDNHERAGSRVIFVGAGNFSSATDQIFMQLNPGKPFGTFRGQVVDKDYFQPAPQSWVDVFSYDRNDPRAVLNRKTFTRADVKEDGTFECQLPILDEQDLEGRFFIGTGARSRQFGLSERSIVVKPGQTVERQMQVGRPAILKVKVIDSITSQPLAARIRFEAIPPTLPADFDNIESVAGYANSFYVPREGASIELNQGFYTLTASSGLSYNLGKTDVEMAWGFETEAVIAIENVSPTPGWASLELGVMTNATPGCTLTPHDAVLMCAGEGLEWLVSGDLETITDLQPAIEALGMSDKLKSSRGFRTHLPKRPLWGEFLVYKVGPDAPDPKTVRDQWRDLTDSTEFIATLRRLYPGALIHVCYPWLHAAGVFPDTGGYFHQLNWSVHIMAYEDSKREEKLEMNIDSVSAFHRRGGWQFQWEKDFFFIGTLRSRFLIPIPACETRVPFLSEPGYPRMLVLTDVNGLNRVDEQLIFSALKAGKWQLTSGPFLDFRSDGRREGDIYQPTDNKAFVRFTITAPDWAETTNTSLNLDGIMLWKESDNTRDNLKPSRFTFQGETKFSPQHKENSDTLLDIETYSEAYVDGIIPRRPGTNIKSFTFNGPVFIDTNGNGKWDPPSYRDKGK